MNTQQNNTDVDVVVVGGGPVGLTLALLLADDGARISVIESMTAPGDLPRAISIADESFRILDRLGLADTLKAESYLDTGARYFGLGDRMLAQSKPSPSRTGHPAKSQFDQPVLEQLLWDRAVEHPAIDFRMGERAVAITQDETSVTVTTRSQDGVTSTVVGSWLAGADGGRSFTRDALGVPLVGSTQEERWVVVDLLNTTREKEPYAEFHGNGDRPYVLVPGIKGRLRLEFMMLPGDDAEEITRPEKIRELVLPFHPQVTPEDVRRAVVYVAHRRLAKTYRVGRAFLVGDAGHLMPPFSGQGLNAGLRDASNLAWKLRAVLDGVATERLLDSYESERRTHAKKMVRISHITGSIVMARGVAAVARDVVFAVARLFPPVHAYLSGMRFITPPDYAAGIAVKPGREVDPRLAEAVGKAMSQPKVESAEGTASPLDAHLGTGWAILELGGKGTGQVARNPFWNGVPRLRIRPRGHHRGPEETGPSDLIDLTGAFVDPTRPLEVPHAVVVRPDRYVAGVFTAADEARVVAELRTYVDLSRSVDRSRRKENR